MTSTAQVYGLPDRNPPYSIEAEQSVLGSMMLSREAVADVTEVLRPEDFYKDAHGKIYRIACELYAKGEAVDPITVAEMLRVQGELESVGDRTYLHLLANNVPTTANAVNYARLVQKMATLRRLIEASARIAAIGYNIPDDLEEALDEAENIIYQVAHTERDTRAIDWKSLLTATYDEIEALFEGRTVTDAIPTGFPDLDNVITGLRPSNLVIVAARPSMGKTSFVLNIAANVAVREKRPVAVFSLEMSAKELALRMLSSQARINGKSLQTGKFQDSTNDWDKLIRAMNTLADAPIFIDDNAGISIMELRSKIRRMKSRNDLALVIVDYIQLMNFDRRMENRVQEIAAISRALKIIGRDFNVPVIAVSQLSREPEKRQNRRPLLSDLRESGAIEQDADLIIFIYREDMYTDRDRVDADVDVKGLAEIIVAKHRHGPVGTVNLAFNGEYTRFDSMPPPGYRP